MCFSNPLSILVCICTFKSVRLILNVIVWASQCPSNLYIQPGCQYPQSQSATPPPPFKNGQRRLLHSMPYMYIWPSYVNFHMWVSFLPIFAMGFIGTRLVSRANLEWKKTSPVACEPTNCATACRCIFTWLRLCFDKPLPAGKAIRTIRGKPCRKWPWAGDASLARYSFFILHGLQHGNDDILCILVVEFIL